MLGMQQFRERFEDEDWGQYLTHMFRYYGVTDMDAMVFIIRQLTENILQRRVVTFYD